MEVLGGVMRKGISVTHHSSLVSASKAEGGNHRAVVGAAILTNKGTQGDKMAAVPDVIYPLHAERDALGIQCIAGAPTRFFVAVIQAGVQTAVSL